MHFSRLAFLATAVLCALPSALTSPAPIDASLPNAVIPKNTVNKLSVNEYVGNASTISLAPSPTSVSGSAVATLPSTSTSGAIYGFSLSFWSWGLMAGGTAALTLL
ncbi:hypothetical protein GALMADRAFT_140260 [Galerina marginata CBS 339.88]|uniref:REJ domain-containing protein n=1 Tax=Galerina marginata (strain CBS 339.88) TaxID=685588 RepID=A0A067T6U0_GALM3|nr:hypothetical protein GALMADRAFT_140260 [Galerina marginata CBS 339.88]